MRAPLPYRKQDKMIELAERSLKKHESLGAESPLAHLEGTDKVRELVERAKSLRKQALEARQLSESLNEEARIAIGIDPSQTASTPDTLYNWLHRLRGFLLSTYKGNEEKLSEWGFDVTVGTAKLRRKKE